MEPTPLCPAAEIVHPVTSSNEHDVECRVAGQLRPAVSPTTNEPVICLGDYTKCGIWRGHKDAMAANRTVAVAESLRGNRAKPLST